jgi:hypothetical protein|tara:strand:+ start:929 stop:3013 length:2085 start_codon:yes stop_codon:yes gene_type:complete
MSLVNFSDLDFDQIKTSIKDYLRSNSNFTDYDFEGSNLSTIIDVLAYNTYITSYNANMLSNEVFLDSATLRENVVSLARNIGYVPSSKKAALANISFFVDTSALSSQPETLTVNKGPIAVSRLFGAENYTFNLLDDVTATVSNQEASFDNISVYEGTYVTTKFTVDSFDPNQRFILPNAGIDVSTIRVDVKPSATSLIKRKYIQADSLFDVGSESPVYWVQEIADERYELIFGDGVFGIKLDAPSEIEVAYLVTNGEGANNITGLGWIGKVTSARGGNTILAQVSPLTSDAPSFGGKNIESVESVKKYSSRIYSSQFRAVTAADYEAIIPTVFPQAESVAAFGGEDLTPPQFGKVFITIKPINGSYLSIASKENIKSSIRQYSVAGIVPDIIDLKYLYVEPEVTVYYNPNRASSAADVGTIVNSNVTRYAASEEMNKFGARFKYSKFLKIIDDSSVAITSNITTITMRRDLRVVLNSFTEYEICFGNRFYIKNHGHSAMSGVGYNIKSSGFNVSGIVGTVYLADVPNMGFETGVVNLIQLDSPTEPKVVRSNVGTIDYIKGEVRLSPINITGTVYSDVYPLIEISAVPYSNDVIGLQDLYLQLDVRNNNIVNLPDNIASGNDISGSNYLVTSSFANGELVRGPVLLANQISRETATTLNRNINRSRTTSTQTTSATTQYTSTPINTTSGGSSSY